MPDSKKPKDKPKGPKEPPVQTFDDGPGGQNPPPPPPPPPGGGSGDPGPDGG